MPDRLLPRRGRVDGLQRDGDFDELLLVGPDHGVSLSEGGGESKGLRRARDDRRGKGGAAAPADRHRERTKSAWRSRARRLEGAHGKAGEPSRKQGHAGTSPSQSCSMRVRTIPARFRRKAS